MENFPNYPPAVQQDILNGAALAPPVGETSNFVDPPNHNMEALAVAVVCISLAVVAGFLRAYSRLFVAKKVHVEDYIGFAAFGFYAGFLWVYFSFYTICGFFVHQWDIQVKTLFKISYVVIILPLVYASVMLLIKPAILLEWTRIFVPLGQRNKFFWTARTLMLVNILLYFSGIIATSLACIPLDKLWHTWLPGKCIDRKALDVCTAAFNLLLDIFILILPQRVIWKLQMKRSRKIGISLVFSIGLLACACAAGRLYACITQAYDSTQDTTYTLGRTFLWAMAEQTCVLLVFCIPAIPKAFSDTEKGLIGRIVRTMRYFSRLRLPRLGGPKTSTACDRSWPSHDYKNPVSVEACQSQLGPDCDTAISLDSLLIIPTNTEASTEVVRLESEPPVYARRILRTTEIRQDNQTVSTLSAELETACLRQQHTWIGS